MRSFGVLKPRTSRYGKPLALKGMPFQLLALMPVVMVLSWSAVASDFACKYARTPPEAFLTR